MRIIRSFSAFLLVILFSGCSTFSEGVSQEVHEHCIWGYAIVGAAAGSFGGPAGAGAGAFAGTLGGLMACRPLGASAPAPAEPEQSGHFWTDDQDRDGVLDQDDHCPFTPEGVAVDSVGCALDNDGDGVPDYLDQCPETPLGSVVDTNGCTIALVTLSGIHFAFDSAQLTSEAKSILNQAVFAIRSNPSNTINIEGHTDSTGSDAYNQNLSKRRSQSVVDYLVSQGVSSSRLNPIGFGESSPIATNNTREGRAKNRRVEVIAR